MNSASAAALVITAIATVVTAVGGVIAALTLLIPILRRTKNVEHIVNQQATNSTNYIRALQRELKAHNIAIPVDQSATQDEG